MITTPRGTAQGVDLLPNMYAYPQPRIAQQWYCCTAVGVGSRENFLNTTCCSIRAWYYGTSPVLQEARGASIATFNNPHALALLIQKLTAAAEEHPARSM